MKRRIIRREFLKQFKGRDVAHGFFKKLQKTVVSEDARGRVDRSIELWTSTKTNQSNSRNGFFQKEVRTSFSAIEIGRAKGQGCFL